MDLKPYRKAEYPLRTDELTHHQWTSRRYDEQLKRSDHWMQYTEVAPRPVPIPDIKTRLYILVRPTIAVVGTYNGSDNPVLQVDVEGEGGKRRGWAILTTVQSSCGNLETIFTAQNIPLADRHLGPGTAAPLTDGWSYAYIGELHIDFEKVNLLRALVAAGVLELGEVDSMCPVIRLSEQYGTKAGTRPR